MNKTSVKIGKKFSDRLEEIGDYHKCANESCNAGENGERVKLVRVLFQNEASLYCEKCSHAIRQKWTCLFCSCIYTEASHSNNRDQNIWIMCEYKKCCRWTHLECEEVHRNQDLKTKLKDSKYKFHCSECLENHKNKGESPSNDTRVRPIAAMKSTSRRESLSIEENLNDKFAQCLNTESKYEIYTSSLFSYLFSESYQGVEKLIVESKRSLTLESGLNLSLSENELSKDFSQIFDKTRDKRFVVSAKNHPIPKNIACERLPGRKKQYKSVMEYKYNH